MSQAPLLQIELPGIPRVKSGKVREIFDLGDSLLLVATDRISAFDCVMPNGIPRKGEVLTQISHFWFDRFASLVPNHLLARGDDPLPERLRPFAAEIERRFKRYGEWAGLAFLLYLTRDWVENGLPV